MENYITKLPHTFTTSDGAEIAYFTAGKKRKTPLVMLNGLSCNPISYWYLIQHLKKDYYIIYPAHRAHMNSTMGPGGYDKLSISILARDTRELMEHLGIKKAVMVGFSMGVQISFEFYKLFPEMCLGFIVMGGTAGKVFQGRPGGKFVDVLLLPFMKQILDQWENEIKVTWQKSNLFDAIGWAFRFLGEDGKRLGRGEIKYFFKHFTHFDPKAFLTYGNSLTEQDAHMVLPDIQLPTLIFGGGKDIFVPLSFQENLHARISDSTLVTFPEGSHLFPIAYKKEILEAVELFLKENNFAKKRLFGN